ncbi:MAG: aminoacetone oxidase family FAD-binding enzyme, partial [Firmicutes bacterium]|nr:aminoacetone oxidase family FAD-binding enzyme [Bacillota bacterium]
NEYGVETKIERGGRVFPVSDKAADVVKALRKFALKPNVKLKKADAQKILVESGAVTGVKTDKGVIKGERVILCTGGKSYPLTGSDGSGYKMAAALGHTVTELNPSLVPIVTEEKWVRGVMGLTLKNVAVKVKSGGKTVYEDFGEMLFTHFGVSGPIILSMSAHLRDPQKNKYRIEIDLKPALDEKKLSQRITRDFEKYSRKQLINALDDLLPKNLIPTIITLAGLDPRKSVSQITKAERAALVGAVKCVPLNVRGFRPIEEAIVTSGGIKTSEINPSTMESKLINGLFFAGEIIDADGYTGGYNLQMAYSTAYLAGTNV